MRWQRLFADLEAEMDGVARVDLDDEVAVQTRRSRSEVRLVDRLRADRGGTLEVRVAGAGSVRGLLADVGPNWMLFSDDVGGELLVPRFAVLAVSGLGERAATPGPQARLHAAMDFRYALNVVAQDRSHVGVTLADGSVIAGMIDRVGADFVDLTDRVPGEGHTARARSASTVPLNKIAVVRRT